MISWNNATNPVPLCSPKSIMRPELVRKQWGHFVQTFYNNSYIKKQVDQQTEALFHHYKDRHRWPELPHVYPFSNFSATPVTKFFNTTFMETLLGNIMFTLKQVYGSVPRKLSVGMSEQIKF